MKWNVPNTLTVVRLIAAPTVMLVFVLLPRPLADWVALVLFVGASVTDWFDGYLARAWRQQTKLGTMLDPIADKAMVLIALAVIVGLMGLSFFIAVPAALILFREVFVSGLREFLGDTAGTLKVTQLAKWKTTVQMVAITVLFIHGTAGASIAVHTMGMDFDTVQAILQGNEEDLFGLRWKAWLASAAFWVGTALLWVAAGLTLVSGLDYFRKAMPYLKD